MDVTQLLRELTTFNKHAESAVKLLKSISRLEQNRLHNLPQLRTRLTQLDGYLKQLIQNPETFEALQNWADDYRRELLNSEQDFRKLFGGVLEEELKKKGLSLSGQYPDLKTGLFTIELDFDREEAILWYGPKQERLSQCPLNAVEVVKSVEKIKGQLGGNLDKAEFLQRLQEAYSRVVGDEAGDPAPIIDVLTEFAYLLQSSRFLQDPRREHYRGYGRADFSYDLFLLRQSSLPEGLHLLVATRARTRRRRDFLWVPDNVSGRGTTYSHLQFKSNSKSRHIGELWEVVNHE